MIKIKNNFDLKSTITCGQIFRFKELDYGYIVVLHDRVIYLKEDNDYIYIESNNENNLEDVIIDYFDLKRDYNTILKNILIKDKAMNDALIYGKGLKMIHQDPFETVIAYIISQNNRVISIANALNIISKNYGEKVVFKGVDYYLFPKCEELKKLTIEDFRNCKVGFRAKYLYNVVNSPLDLNSIYDMNSEEALEYLMGFSGIGPKVASCILLFAYQKFDVYPIDTWVKKYMKETYNIEGEKNIRHFTSKIYHEYSGLAIQYMFNYKRNK